MSARRPARAALADGRGAFRIFARYRRGELRLDERVTRLHPLDRLGEALDDMLCGRNAKGVIAFEPTSSS